MFSLLKTNQKYFLKISFNNKFSFARFIIFFKKIKFLNFKIKIKPLKTKIQFVSILKSPHINKNAQEQFHKTKNVYVFEFESMSSHYAFCLLLKKIKHNCFADVNVESKGVFDQKGFLYSDNFFTINQEIKKKKNLKTYNYLFLLDNLGELLNNKKN